ncbi:MAG: hypothetical protein FWD61_17215 [Phycisphaerales bacterium]|nr:hypothetical protein [Phycisphaerales bacterium]
MMGVMKRHCLKYIGTWIAVIVVMAMGMMVLAQGGGGNGGGLPPAIAMNDAVAAGKPLLGPQDKAAIIKLHGEVNRVMKNSLERRLDLARKAGCTVVIYEINTYGGLLDSALEISQLTKKLPSESHMATVAWVNNKALSAGVLLATACQHIVMASDATMGDCVPIQISGITGEIVAMKPAERSKLESPLLAELADSAERNNLNKMLLWAMVVPKIEIWEVRNNQTGEMRFVDKLEKDQLLAAQPNAAGGGKAESPWQIVPRGGRIEPVDSEDQVLDVRAQDGLRMGLSRATVDNEQQLRAVLNIHGDVLVMDFTWAEVAMVFLTGFWIRAMLFVAMLVFAWIEFSHPGVSVPGILAVVCLVLLVGAPFLTGLAQVWEIALIVVGLGIIATDVLMFGGVGLLAIPGFILMAIGLVASFVPAEPGGGMSMPATWQALRNGLAVVVFGSMAAMAAFFFLSKYLHVTPGFRRLQLAPTTGEEGKGGGTVAEAVLDATNRAADEAVFVGAVGMAATDLRPAGKTRFGDHLVDVVSFGSFIGQGSEVEVVEVLGNRVVVRPRMRAANTGSSSGGQAT